MTKRFTLLFFFCLSLILSLSAQDLGSTINSHFTSKTFSNSLYSYHIIDTETKQVLASKNANVNLIPASTIKLVTIFTGLLELGEEYRFTTEIGYEGDLLPDGTLEGNLIIIGGGDPSLGSDQFPTNVLTVNQILTTVRNAVIDADINCIDGHILVYNNFASDPPVHPSWQWDDISNYYASGAWGLNIKDNSYNIYFKGDRKFGDPSAILKHEPLIFGLNIESQVIAKEANSGDNAYIYGGPYDYNKIVRGTIPEGRKPFRIKGAMPNPPEFFANEVRRFLEETGIQSHGIYSNPDSYVYSDSFKPLVSFNSPPLSELARYASFESDNLFCESIFKLLSKTDESQGSFSASSEFIERFANSLDLDDQSIKMVDGSGLSFRNRINAKFLNEFLLEVLQRVGPENFKSYLPKCGEEGTVKSLKSLSNAKVWAKSGSMGGVMGYAGVITSRKGNDLLFCVLVNGFSAKNKEVREYLVSFMNSIYLLG